VVVMIGQVLALRFLGEELFDQRFDDGQAENLIAGRPVARRDVEHELDNGCHLLAEVVRNARVLALDHLLVQALHVVGPERRIQSAHLVQHATQRPNVTLRVVRHVAPHFRACVVGRAGLRVTEALLDDLGDVEVAELGLHVPV